MFFGFILGVAFGVWCFIITEYVIEKANRQQAGKPT